MEKTNKKIKFQDWPKYSKTEINLVKKIIETGKVNYWTGKYCRLFENSFKKKFGLKYALTVANGSLALDAAINSLSLKKNDEVLVTPRSYISTASCIQKTEAKIKFVDVDLNTQNIDLNELKKKINNKTKLIICVHLAGWPCDVAKIKKLIGKRKIFIIEDCSQAHGSKINNKYVGNEGDISVWSFCNDKIMSTLGEGGMIACKSTKIYKKIWSLRDCGKNIDKIINKPNNYLFKWIHDYEGTNLRMTEIQAAVGIQQLKLLDITVKKRNSNLKFIWKNIINNENIYSPLFPSNIHHAGYRCYLFAKNLKIRNKFIEFLNKSGIDANQGSCPEIYREKRFSKIKKFNTLKNAKKLGETSISLPCHNLITKNQLNLIMKKINFFIEKNC